MGRNRTANVHRRGFSLASILLLTAVIAVFFAAIASAMLRHHELNRTLLVVYTAIGVVVGMLVGLLVGLQQERRIVGAIVGLVAGMPAGAAGGVLLAVPGKLLPIAVGSVVLVLFALLVRFLSAGPSKP